MSKERNAYSACRFLTNPKFFFGAIFLGTLGLAVILSRQLLTFDEGKGVIVGMQVDPRPKSRSEYPILSFNDSRNPFPDLTNATLKLTIPTSAKTIDFITSTNLHCKQANQDAPSGIDIQTEKIDDGTVRHHVTVGNSTYFLCDYTPFTVNEDFHRRTLTIQNYAAEKPIGGQTLSDQQDDATSKFLPIQVNIEEIEELPDIRISGGLQPDESILRTQADRVRWINTNHPKTRISWDDVKAANWRDIYLVIVSALVGLGTAVFIEIIKSFGSGKPKDMVKT